MVDTDFMEFNTTFNDEGVGYYVCGNLAIGYDANGTTQSVRFSHKNAPLIIYGAFRTSSSSTIYLGSYAVDAKAANTRDRVLLITHGGDARNQSSISGQLFLYGVTVTYGGAYWGEYQFAGWNNSYGGAGISASSGSKIVDCDFYPMGNGYAIDGTPDLVLGCRFGGIRAASYNANPFVKVKTTSSEGIGCRHQTVNVFIEPENVYTSFDVIWSTQYTAFLVDPTFDSHNQKLTTNEPWVFLGYLNSLDGCFVFATTLKIKVIDKDGNPIQGATVTCTDANGNSALFVATTAKNNESFSLTDTILTVTDGTQFSVGDYIRFQYGQEIMKVTAVNGNNLTVERAKLGSKAARYNRTVDYVYKQVSSLTTDENGEVDCGYLYRYVLFPTEKINGLFWVNAALPDTHIANGYLTKTDHTPHTVTISKDGYQTKTIKYTMDRKREEIEVLEPAVKLLMPMGKKIYKNLKPSDGQNKVLWEEI